MASKLREVAERLFAEVKGQPLGDWIAGQRAAGKSWRAIARDLDNEIGVDLTDVTLINWYGDSDREPAA